MKATRFIVTNNCLPKSTIKAAKKKKILKPNPFLQKFYFVWIFIRSESSVDVVIALHKSFYHFSLEHSEEYV